MVQSSVSAEVELQGLVGSWTEAVKQHLSPREPGRLPTEKQGEGDAVLNPQIHYIKHEK